MDYSKITDEQFDKALLARMGRMSAADIISIPGIYEIMSEYLNNAVLDDITEEAEAESDLEGKA